MRVMIKTENKPTCYYENTQSNINKKWIENENWFDTKVFAFDAIQFVVFQLTNHANRNSCHIDDVKWAKMSTTMFAFIFS